ncbi:PP2C family protein-serine/threonine phosphatase [Streptomyces sp. NPDC015127]|uniref:PP2C family protein-serine/threonine phosphatase n=1 Tax=Streptomyces sp. NPDC015127 TaxID=3364939 RepID=UPI0036F5DF7F
MSGQDEWLDRVRARLEAVDRALELIGSRLDERTVCAELTQFLCPSLCEAAAVDLLIEDVVADRPHEHGPPARICARGREDLLDAGTDTAAQSVAALDEGHAIRTVTTLAGGRPVTHLHVPLLAHGRAYGVLLAARPGEGFTEDETATIHYAARLAAVLIGHARAHASVRSTALNLQRALLAEPGQPHPNLEVATRYLPAGNSTLVGGDWFETVRLHYGRTLLVVGDVMGHGLDAAVDMNAYRSALRYVASADLPPHRVLRQLDATSAGRRPATCLLIRVDPTRRVAAIASAGHLPPVLFTADNTAEVVPVPVGPPLGTGVGGYELITRTMVPGQTLLLFTDGLVERRGEDIDVSLARLAGRWLRPGADVEDLLDTVVDRFDAHHAEDDVAILAARIRRRPPAAHDSTAAPHPDTM